MELPGGSCEGPAQYGSGEVGSKGLNELGRSAPVGNPTENNPLQGGGIGPASPSGSARYALPVFDILRYANACFRGRKRSNEVGTLGKKNLPERVRKKVPKEAIRA